MVRHMHLGFILFKQRQDGNPNAHQHMEHEYKCMVIKGTLVNKYAYHDPSVLPSNTDEQFCTTCDDCSVGEVAKGWEI